MSQIQKNFTIMYKVLYLEYISNMKKQNKNKI